MCTRILPGYAHSLGAEHIHTFAVCTHFVCTHSVRSRWPLLRGAMPSGAATLPSLTLSVGAGGSAAARESQGCSQRPGGGEAETSNPRRGAGASRNPKHRACASPCPFNHATHQGRQRRRGHGQSWRRFELVPDDRRLRRAETGRCVCEAACECVCVRMHAPFGASRRRAARASRATQQQQTTSPERTGRKGRASVSVFHSNPPGPGRTSRLRRPAVWISTAAGHPVNPPLFSRPLPVQFSSPPPTKQPTGGCSCPAIPSFLLLSFVLPRCSRNRRELEKKKKGSGSPAPLDGVGLFPPFVLTLHPRPHIAWPRAGCLSRPRACYFSL